VSAEALRARLLRLSGRVQRVGFRNYAWRRAQKLGLQGWVRNLPDGRVEAFVQGADAAVAVLEAILGRGPSNAEVTEAWGEDRPLDPTLRAFTKR